MAGVPRSLCTARSLFAPPTIGSRRAPRGVLLLWLGAVVLGATACTDGGRLPGLPWSDDDSDGAGDDSGAGSGGIGEGEGEGEGEAAGACSALRASFDDEVWPLLQGRCLACHVADGAAGRTRLVLDPASGERNRRLVGLLARSDVANEPLLLVKPRGGAEHGGGAVLDATSAEYRTLDAFIARVRAPGACEGEPLGSPVCEAPSAPSAKLRLLTRAELDASLRDAFGVSSTTAIARLPDETDVNGFDNAANFLLADDARVDGILAAAAELVPAIVADLSCTTRDRACVAGLVQTRLPRLWRRPVTASETGALLQRYDDERAAGGSFDEGVEAVVLAAVSAPDLLYRREQAVTGALDAREAGDLLAYTITGAPPDDALRAAIDDGTILQATVREAHARRLLTTAAGQERLVEFVSQWLNLQRLATTTKSASAFPDWDDALRDALHREARAYVKSALFDDDGSLRALLGAPVAFVDARSAPLYGVTAPQGAAGEVVDVVAGEDLTAITPGASGIDADNGGFVLYVNGAVRTTLQAPAADTWVVATSTSCDVVQGEGCVFEVLVDGLLVGTRTSEAPPQAPVRATFTVPLQAGTHDVEVRFLNNLFVDAAHDRNLRIVEVALQRPAADRVERDGLVRVPTPERPGLLLKAGVLAAFSNALGSSPVKRGKLIRNRLLCTDIPPPPADVTTTPPTATPGGAIHTTRDRYAVHATNARCAACHDQIDPLGFAFEHYDGIGVRRDDEGGFPIDASGVLQGTLDSDVAFTDALDLVAALRDSADVRRCLAHSYAMHVFGSARAFSESCVDPGIAALVRDDDSIVELAARLPGTDAFVRRSTP